MKTWNTIDKSSWERGDWDDEPDKAHWVDDKTGLDCLIVRGPSGALCGYVGIPERHSMFGKDYCEVDADVHGGLTFADACQDTGDESKGICHPEDGCANKNVWWLGFDCAHSGDVTPGYESRIGIFRGHFDSYKRFGYVKLQVESLAVQLVQMTN